MAAEKTEGVNFSDFVLWLATMAAVQLGDVAEPGAKENPEPNLDGAAQMIDLLALLEEKTHGNLTPDEERLVAQVLYDLRMRFIQVRDGQQKRIIIP
jgi:hypothetical protein